jgi:hypothetical protein
MIGIGEYKLSSFFIKFFLYLQLLVKISGTIAQSCCHLMVLLQWSEWNVVVQRWKESSIAKDLLSDENRRYKYGSQWWRM